MVYQLTATFGQAAARGSRERCRGCGYGLGQFQVEYASTDDNVSGRGYCSLDCYTSAKVTGRTMQTQGRSDMIMGYDRQHRGNSSRRFYAEPQPQPWPTGLVVDAPPSPKPWRGRTSTSLSSHHNMGWRVQCSASTSTLSTAADETSSPESSVADWQGAESEDGETSVDSVSGSGAGAGDVVGPSAGVGARGSGGAAAVSNHMYGSSSGGAAVPMIGTNGGANSFGVAGHRSHSKDGTGRPHSEGVKANDRRVGGGGAIAAWGVQRERMPPLAPIPRVGAFPARHRVYGTGNLGGCGLFSGGRKVHVRTVNPHALAIPTLRPPLGRGAALRRGPLPPGVPPTPAAASATEAASSTAVDGARGTSNSSAAAEEAKGLGREESASSFAIPGAAVDDVAGAMPASDVFGTTSPGRETSKETPTTLEGAFDKAASGNVRMADAAAGKTNTQVVTTSRSNRSMGGTRCTSAATVGSAEAESGAEVLARQGLVSCAPVRAVPTRIVVREWRRLFLP